MQQSLDHLPEYKQREVQRVVQIIRKTAKVEMIILYGSYARGDWVEDKYVEEHVLYEYTSDYDVLVIVKDEKKAQNLKLWKQVQAQIDREKSIKTPVSMIVDTIDFVNTQLNDGRYFYVDIQNEGVLLYDSKKHTLAQPKELTPKEQRALAEQDRELWLPKAQSFLDGFVFYRDKGDGNLASFHLHQATEALLICCMLVASGYRPKTHDLEKLLKHVLHLDTRFQDVFPRSTNEEEKRFRLLQKAYVDARYSKNYTITEEELQGLYESAEALKSLVEETCQKMIEGFG